jgi:CheY-like chemotaxis protein
MTSEVPFPQSVLRGSGCVLVADDQPDVRKFVADALADFGYDVVEAGDAQEALDILSAGERRVDVLLSDVVISGRSGRDLARQARRTQPGIGIVLMSGYPPQDDPGPENFTFLPKPFGPEDLAREIQSTLAGNGTRRILVVDDESDVRAFLRKVLEKAGYEVLEAADGNQAIRSVRAHRIDLVIIDLVMPHQDGIGTIPTLRRNVPGIGIIVISGAFDGRYLKTAETLGADVALAKPFGADEVVESVERILRSRGRHRPGVDG